MSWLSEATNIDIKVDEHGIRLRHASDEAKQTIEHNVSEFLKGPGTAEVIPILDNVMTSDQAHALAAEITATLEARLAAWLESL